MSTKFKTLFQLLQYYKWLFFSNGQEPIYFFTFHKCASSLFSKYVLKKTKNVNHIDYAWMLYKGFPTINIDLNKKGTLYGPIRLSANQSSPVYQSFIQKTVLNNFTDNKKAYFLLRDPRDIIVSAYFSFGFTHGFSKVGAIKSMQKQQRTEISEISIDEFAISEVSKILEDFSLMQNMIENCSESVVLKYEEMINDWETFKNMLQTYLEFDEVVLKEIHKQSRPKRKENINEHRRSGQPENYKSHLKPETLILLNEKLAPVLSYFGYKCD